jgi:integrase
LKTAELFAVAPAKSWRGIATYRSKKDVRDLAEQYLAPANAGHIRPDSSLTFSEFTEKQFFSHIEDKIGQGYKKPSTLKFYKDVYNNHLKKSVGDIRLRDFNTLHAQELLDRIDREKDLSHKSLLRIKTGISAIFTFAKQRNILQGVNPVQGVKVEGRKTKPTRFDCCCLGRVNGFESRGDSRLAMVGL